MKVAVTGASGFVGRHVLQALARMAEVQVMATSRSEAGEWLPKGMQHIALDLAAAGSDSFAKLGRPDALIHLAWNGLPNYQSLHHFESELGQQYRFLSSLVEAGLPSLLCTGTCFEYGMQSGELHESMATDPRNAYGFAKDALRRELELLSTARRFQFTWARLFYMYGEGQSPTSLYSQFTAAVSRGDDSFPMSGGEQLRDYLPVSQAADFLVELALRRQGQGIVNVCAGRPVSVRALVEEWVATRRPSMKLALGHYSYPTYEPMAFWGSNAKLIRSLGDA